MVKGEKFEETKEVEKADIDISDVEILIKEVFSKLMVETNDV